MARKPLAKLKCAFCGEITATNATGKHLAACDKRQPAIEKAEKGDEKSETLYHVRACEPHHKDFWLDLEIKGSAKLKDLDYYLREIWLECCGHLSEFSAGGWGSATFAMSKKIGEICAKHEEFLHIYDFGSSSETALKVVGSRTGKPLSKRPIYLLARNVIPDAKCLDCDEKAEYLCMECLYERDGGLVCKKHSVKHKAHDDYGECVELYNSPRMGVCGYEGPAKPPY